MAAVPTPSRARDDGVERCDGCECGVTVRRAMGFLTRFIASGIQDDTARAEARAAHVKKVTAKCDSLYVRSMRSIERASRREWCEDEDEDEDEVDRTGLRATTRAGCGWQRESNACSRVACAERVGGDDGVRAWDVEAKSARPRGFSSSKTRQPID
jgi:hypothetical protein